MSADCASGTRAMTPPASPRVACNASNNETCKLQLMRLSQRVCIAIPAHPRSEEWTSDKQQDIAKASNNTKNA